MALWFVDPVFYILSSWIYIWI